MKNIVKLSVLVSLLQFATGYGIEVLFRAASFPVSVADFVVTSGENWNAGLVLGNLILFILLHTCRDDFRTMAVLHHDSSEQILTKQEQRLVTYAVFVSVCSVLSVVLYGWMRRIPWNNWNVSNSYFRFAYGSPVRSIYLLEIVINQILSEIVIFIIVGLFGLIVLWMNHKAIYVFLVMNVIWTTELCMGARVFHNLLRVRQEMWVHPYWFLIRIGYAAALLVIEITVLRRLARQREYL